ncbi:hypothetical protein C8R44DRAFT_880073 [Mycena epipterygia]|nr:hypothetical protein C8R44DRAFT_880073 [Mycena epipterygia]
MDPHAEDDNEESQYNDGRGLQFIVEFTGLIPLPAAGNKTWKNAKAPVIKKSIYVHKDSELNTLLNAALHSLGR